MIVRRYVVHGPSVRRARVGKGLTQAEVARRMGLTKAYVSRIECSRRMELSEIRAKQLQQHLDFDIDKMQ